LRQSEVVITGMGIVSPIGIGRQAFWDALCRGQSGIAPIQSFDAAELPVCIAGEVRDFEPKRHVAQRKQLKVMSRDAQLGVAAAALACTDAGIAPGKIDSNRFGVVLGADRICTALDDSEPTYLPCLIDGRFDFSLFGTVGMAGTFPLNFLKVLPNMIASHVSIFHDARGPNNTIHQAEVSGLLAVAEAADVIRRGAADIMLAGGASAQLNPFDCVRHNVMGILSRRQDDPTAAMRPFDADRDGQVFGEGAAVFVLESRRHAEARGAHLRACIRAAASTCDPRRSQNGVGMGLRRAMQLVLERAEVSPQQLAHINAHGLSTREDDAIEARTIFAVAPETPVTAPKSYFGNLGAVGGTMEMAVSVLALNAKLTPPTLNYRRPDPACPIRVIHGEPASRSQTAALLINRTQAGQAAAMVLTAES
jgi:3-oxoacyl-[acyl-carrier-protein] synthase II